jgi:NADH-quinone oxidoreductase subunit N
MAVGLAVFAVMMSLVGAFYYLRVVKVMYFDAPVSTTPAVSAALDVRAVLTLNGGLLLLLGLVPGRLDDPVCWGRRQNVDQLNRSG